MHMPTRYFTVPVLGSLVLALTLMIGCEKSQTSEEAAAELEPRVLEVNVVAARKGQIKSSIDLTGTLFPWKFATVASEVTGIVESVRESDRTLHYQLKDGTPQSKTLPLDIGLRVSKGDELLRIGSSEQRYALQLAQAKLNLAEKELANLFAWKRSEEVEQLRAQCEECDAVLVDAEADLERAETLVARNASSRKELEDAQRSVATAKAAKKRAEAALKLAEAGPTEEQIEVAKAQLELAKAEVAIKQDQVDKCTIYCPLEQAWIVERYVGVGDHVTANPSTSLMRLVDSSILLAQVHVPERYQGLIKVGDRASVVTDLATADSEPGSEVDAMVVLINAQIDPETRTFRVRVGIDNSKNLFKAGTFAKVSIPLDTAADAVVVPNGAISFSDGQPAAFVVRDGIIDRVPVELGVSNRTQYQVTKGLAENDLVVDGDLTLLAPGLRVQPRRAGIESTPAESPSETPSQG